MSGINWDSENLTYDDILKGFLGNVDDEDFRYDGNFQNNPLAQVLIEMLEISTTKINITNLIRLDAYGIVENKLVNLWRMCGENAEYFSKTVSYMTGTFLSRCFTQEEVEKNMELDEPIEFIPNSDVVPFFSELHKSSNNYDSSLVDELVYSLRMNLVTKYNDKVKKGGLNYPLLEVPKKEIDQNKELDGNEIIDPKKLYFGLNTVDLSGGVLGMNMKTYGLFERTRTTLKIANEPLFVLREIPTGEMLVIDKNGILVQLEEEVSYEGGTLFPNKKFVNLEIGPLSRIMEDAKNRCLDNDVITKYDELLRNGATVSDFKGMFSDLADVYSTLYGGIDRNKGL